MIHYWTWAVVATYILRWSKIVFSYSLANAVKIIMKVSIRSYTDADIVIFSQIFPKGLHNTSTGDMDSVISSFPSFQLGDKSSLGLLSFGGLFGKREIYTAGFSNDMEIASGLGSGPMALFNTAGDTLIMSTFTEFMAASLWHDSLSKTLRWGIMGKVYKVPPGFGTDTILYFTPRGINKAFTEWGTVLMTYYRTFANKTLQDHTLSNLGFYTDNGGYYYHNTEKGNNYEGTVFDLVEYAKESIIPYRYLQYDDWWYFVEGHGYGATFLWDPRPSVFPHGLEFIYQRVGLPVIAHNRYWSSKTPYAKQNGGRFNFIVYKDLSLPLDPNFWNWLFKRGLAWGLVTYEQDFLNYQTERIFQLHADVKLGRLWLKQMADAASSNGLTLQYCMALPRHLLQSVELPAVTQARVSNDYLVTEAQWRIGLSSILAYSLGLAPFKDNFWSKSVQPGNPYNRTEDFPLLEATVAILSTGPVAPSDKIGLSNVNLLSRLHRADGVLLKPDHPAFAIDSQIHEMAFKNGSGPDGEVWTTYTDISGLKFGLIFAADIKTPYSLTPEETRFHTRGNSYMITSSIRGQLTIDPPLSFSETSHLILDNCTKSEPCLWSASPELTIGNMSVVIGGEVNKFVPMSRHRVLSINVNDVDVLLAIQGAAGEQVTFAFYVNQQWRSIKCVMSKNRESTISISQNRCW